MPKARTPSSNLLEVGLPAVSDASNGPMTEAMADRALPATYEEAMAELEQVARRLESGEVPLDQLLSGYQRAAVLMQFCKERLEAVEEQIKVLDGGVLKAWKPAI